MKKTFPILLVLLLLVAPAPLQAQFKYTTNNGAITLAQYTGTGGAVVISNFVNIIAGWAFESCTNLTSVTIPGSVTNIGEYAFEECYALTNANMNNGVTSIEDFAFYQCISLASVTIPGSVTSIGVHAFAYCADLTSVTFHNGLTTIGDFAFYVCSGLTNITISGSVTSIGEFAFAACTSLTSVTIPKSVTNIEEYAFSACTSLADVCFEGNASKNFSGSAFNNDTSGSAADSSLTKIWYVSGATGWGSTYDNLGIIPTDPCKQCGSTPVGDLQATISPGGAITAGARWQVDKGTTNDSGTTVSNLSVGSHTVSFTTISAWNTPAAQTVTIKNGVTTEASGVYKAWPSNSAMLILQTNGYGTTQHGAWPPELVMGNKYTVTAAPKPGSVFSNWVASGSENFVSNIAALKFTMQSNLTLTANFITNPFPAIQGTYNGLFSQANLSSPVTEQSSGFATITIASTSKGAYSAALKVDGGFCPFSGMFDLDGNSATNIKRTGKSALTLTLHIDLNLDPPADSMTGSVEATNWAGPSSLLADLAWFNGTMRKATNYAGKYTFVLPGTPGYSMAEFNNSLAGTAILTGSLADKTTITSLSTPISRDGYVPIYYSYLPGTNLLFGWLNFTTNPAQTVEGNLTWFKLPTASKVLYSGGFTNQTNIIGSFYLPVTTNTLVTSGTLTIVDLSQAINLVYTNVSIVSNKLTCATTTTNQLNATITPATGAMSLSFRPTGAEANLTAQGVMLQNSPTNPPLKAAGWFAGTNQTGYFLLTQ